MTIKVTTNSLKVGIKHSSTHTWTPFAVVNRIKDRLLWMNCVITKAVYMQSTAGVIYISVFHNAHVENLQLLIT
jgi:hypothetical protein